MITILQKLSGSVLVTPVVCMVLALASSPPRAEEQTRDVPTFDSVVFGGSGNLEVTVGEDQSVVLEGDARLLEKVKTTVQGGRLVIKWDEGWSFFQKQ